ncbi:hypothetical protein NLX82_13690 [Paenibacillus sp. A3M_27_13]|uniref:hypothetical protein n=1 Tax=Paenibacillus TaxID=44249 RepID=UPI001C648343|nr:MULTISPECIES: hypothetical protein [Paenibacillus]MCP3745463.1 hypothetical protein [Paenibacillus sp. A3M_27_13]WDZ64230.1 hypothetical protein MF628_08415 [Paenibacillus polymyxa]
MFTSRHFQQTERLHIRYNNTQISFIDEWNRDGLSNILVGNSKEDLEQAWSIKEA